MLAIVYIILILLLLIILYLMNSHSKFEQNVIRIIEAEENLDNFLSKKSEILYDICKYINEINKNKVFANLEFLEKNDYDSFKLDKELSELDSVLKEYLIVNKSFVPNEEIETRLNELEKNEIELDGSKIFYNNNAKFFNYLADRFPTRVIAKRRNYDYKYLFSFEKEEFFQIMVNKKKSAN